MSVSRRDFIHAACGTALGLVVADRAAASLHELIGLGRSGAHAGQAPASRPHGGRPAFFFEWKDVGPDGPVALRAGFGEGGNSLAIIERGVAAVLVDTKNCPYGNLLAQDLIALDEPPMDKLQQGAHAAELRLVINTHHHADHTGGNNAFAGKVDHLAHPKAIERIAAQIKRYQDGAAATIKRLESSDKPEDKGRAGVLKHEIGAAIAGWTAKDFVPTRALKSNVETIQLGKIRIVLHHFGPGHTDNDVLVHLPEQNVMHCGDLLFNNTWPYFDTGSGATSAGWINSCKKAIELCNADTVLVAGHGELGDVEALRRQVALFEDLAPKASAAVKAGQSRDEFIKTATPGYDGYAAGDRIRPVTLGGLFDEAKAAG